VSEFTSAFQNLVEKPMPPLPGAHEIAMEGVRRDQRRTRFLAVLCLVLWVLGAAGMALLVTGLNQFVMGARLNNFRVAAPRAESVSTPTNNDRAADRDTTDEQRKQTPASRQAGRDDQVMVWDDGTSLLHHSLPLIDGSLVALLLAAFSTVLLVFSSRRTTLNRINISLAQICEQLKQMSRTPPGEAAHDPPAG
jgi:hypothetical protein